MSTGHFFGAESRVEAQRLFEGDLHGLSFGAGRVVVDREGLRRLIEELEAYEQTLPPLAPDQDDLHPAVRAELARLERIAGQKQTEHRRPTECR